MFGPGRLPPSAFIWLEGLSITSSWQTIEYRKDPGGKYLKECKIREEYRAKERLSQGEMYNKSE